jgi:prepilin-type N-terminal cleavage/methylation domain-containing protein
MREQWSSGSTLVELLVVLVVIAILATVLGV